MPISDRPKWYDRKPPTLQIRIFNEIATGKPLSKKMATKITGSHYSDVSDAIKNLLKKKLIVAADISFRSNNRDKVFYKLSRKGLQYFIDSIPTPQDFWSALYWYCKMKETPMNPNDFNMSYDRFQKGYLGYTPQYGYFFQFEFVDSLFRRWLDDNKMIIYVPYTEKNTKIPGFVLSERMLECLGMNRLVTLEQLCQCMEEQIPNFEQVYFKGEEKMFTKYRTIRKDEIKDILKRYTLSSNYEKPYHSSRPDISYEYDQKINDYVDLLEHLLIIYRNEDGGETKYELSLYGVALLLSIMAYYDLNHEHLFYNNLGFEEYCEKLALNYQDKIPLVLGKWHILKKGIYDHDKIPAENLKQLFYSRERIAGLDSVLLGGIKEYYEGIEILTKQTFSKLKRIHECGEQLLSEPLEEQLDSNFQLLLARKLDEIDKDLSKRDLQRFIERLSDESNPQILRKDPTSIFEEDLKYMEKAYSDEVSFMFYMFLYTYSPNYKYEPRYSKLFPSVFLKNDIGRTYSTFIDVLNDKDILKLLVNWLNDSVIYQNELRSSMSHFEGIVKRG
jgi:hypothetical protein